MSETVFVDCRLSETMFADSQLSASKKIRINFISQHRWAEQVLVTDTEKIGILDFILSTLWLHCDTQHEFLA